MPLTPQMLQARSQVLAAFAQRKAVEAQGAAHMAGQYAAMADACLRECGRLQDPRARAACESACRRSRRRASGRSQNDGNAGRGRGRDAGYGLGMGSRNKWGKPYVNEPLRPWERERR